MRILSSMIASVLFLYVCSSSSAPAQTKKAAQAAPVAKGKSAVSAARVDACTLLSKAEVEGVVGRRVLAGRKEDSAEISTCDYGNPAAPLAAGRPRRPREFWRLAGKMPLPWSLSAVSGMMLTGTSSCVLFGS
jgi:hypothetical protein